MVQPIQYQIPGALNPFENLVSGLKLGATMADMDAARAQQQAASQLAQQQALAAQAAIARQQQYETGLSKVLTNPNRTYADFEPLFSIAPNKDQLDALKAMGTGADERLKKSQENFTANVLLAIESEPENPETAKRILNERVEAEKDPQQKQLYQTILKAIEVSPEKAAQVVELGGASMFGENWYKGIVNARKRRAEAALEPSALRTAEAAARTGEAAADVAVGTKQAKIDEAIAIARKAQIEIETLSDQRKAELSKAKSDAEIAAINAKYAKQIAQADLRVKNAQAFASGAAAKLTEQQTLKLKNEIARGPLPQYSEKLGGFVVAPTKENPNGGFLPLNAAADVKQQKSAVNALKSAGYDPETGEDRISRLIQESTSGGLQAYTTKALNFAAISTSGSRAIKELESTANNISLDLLDGKIGAGISNADRDFIVGTLGDVANPKTPAGDRLAAWNAARNRMIVSGMLPPPTKVKPEGSFGSEVRSQADAILRGEK